MTSKERGINNVSDVHMCTQMCMCICVGGGVNIIGGLAMSACVCGLLGGEENGDERGDEAKK